MFQRNRARTAVPRSTRATIESIGLDVRHTLRLLRRNPTFSLAALATLGLGIGLNTAIFSVAYGVLWRPLPYPNPDRLIMISSAQEDAGGIRDFETWAPRSYDGLRTHVTTLESLSAYSSLDTELTGRGDALQASSLNVSPNFFNTLGVQPALGRAFRTGDGAAEDDHSVIISDRLWHSVFKADPSVVGQTISVDGVVRTVVGVLPPDFSFKPLIRIAAQPSVDVFVPNRWPGDKSQSAFLFLLGRMTPGTTRERAEAELTSLANEPSIASHGARTAAGTFSSSARTVARITALQDYGTESVRTLLVMLVGAVSFVLLIACVNVANLQMARLTARRGELSVRMALGAGRVRIVRQLLTEAVVLSLAGTVLGVILAQAAIVFTLPLVPPSVLPRVGGIVIDGRMLAFCLGLAVFSTLVIGLLPALRVSRTAFGDSRTAQAADRRTTSDTQGERVRTVLVAAQIAMTLILLIGAGLLINSFLRLTSVSPGFESNGSDGALQVVRVKLPDRLYVEPERIQAFSRDVLGRVRLLPGVTSASVINSVPFALMFIQGAFEIEGQPKPTLSAGIPKVEAHYFKTMGIPLIAGREFTDRDTAAAPKVAILSERVVREYFPGGPQAALGQRVRLGLFSAEGDWLTVIGVAADIRQQGLDRDVKPMIYAPFQQERAAPFLLRFVSFVVRTSTPASVAEGIRAEIRRTAPDVPVASTATMDEALAASVAGPRFRTVLLGLFAAAATVIAALGLYGVMAYTVTQRTREIGIRVALGATRRNVLVLILSRAMRVIVAGLFVGLAGAAVLTRVLQSFLFGVTPTDPLVFAAVTLLLLAVGLVAAWLPARSATRIDPWRALRAD